MKPLTEEWVQKVEEDYRVTKREMEAVEFIPELEKLREDTQKLNVFAVEVRYPGFDAQSGDAKEALLSMERVAEVLKGYFNKSFA